MKFAILTAGTVFVLTVFFLPISQQQRRPVSSGSFGSEDSNVDRLLSDRKYVNKQINCVLDRGPCDTFGANLKASIPEVLSRNCESCSPQQAANARKVINFVKRQHPDVWNQVVEQYSDF